MTNPKTVRQAFRDAVRDHGPPDAQLRLILLNLADFMNSDGTGWATRAALARQSCLEVRALYDRMKQLDGIWFQSTKRGRRYDYLVTDPGPGVSVPTLDEIRHRHDRAGIAHENNTGTVVHEHRHGGAKIPASKVPPRRIETSKDVPPGDRSLAPGGSRSLALTDDRPAPAPGCVRCPDCNTDQQIGQECGYCLKNPPTLVADLDADLDIAIGGA